MKYESDILEMIHENALTEFRLGLISEAEMREYDELCLPEEALQSNTAQGDNAHETVIVRKECLRLFLCDKIL
jgi:DNA-binding transcriptional regulator YiaG